MPEEYGPLKLKVPKGKGDGAKAPQAFKDFADSITKPPTGAAKQLAIVQSDGSIVYKTPKGDATLAEDGALTIADKVVTSRKWKPSSGIARLTESKTLTESLVDMPGLEVKNTPEVASIMCMTLTADFFLAAAGVGRAELLVDGVSQTDAAELSPGGSVFFPVTQVYRFELTAAAHTIKVQARKGAAGPEVKLLKAGAINAGCGSSLLWMLHAA